MSSFSPRGSIDLRLCMLHNSFRGIFVLQLACLTRSIFSKMLMSTRGPHAGTRRGPRGKSRRSCGGEPENLGSPPRPALSLCWSRKDGCAPAARTSCVWGERNPGLGGGSVSVVVCADRTEGAGLPPPGRPSAGEQEERKDGVLRNPRPCRMEGQKESCQGQK